jgi:hypothetical protein
MKCKRCGKDYAAQCFADAVQWYMLVGAQQKAEQPDEMWWMEEAAADV